MSHDISSLQVHRKNKKVTTADLQYKYGYVSNNSHALFYILCQIENKFTLQCFKQSWRIRLFLRLFLFS